MERSTSDVLADLRKKAVASAEVDPYGRRFTLDEFMAANIPEPDPLVEGILPSGATLMIGGQHKVGKTMLMTQLAMAVAGGIPFLGFDTTAGRVLYLNYEVAAWSFKKRISKQFVGIQRLGVTDEATLRRIRRNLIVESLPPLRVNKHSDLIDLGEYAKRERVGLIVIDPLRGAFQGDRNKDDTVDRVMQDILDSVVKASGAGVVMGHHLRKPPSGEQVTGSTWDLKGSSGFADAADGIITIRRDPSDHSTLYASFTLRHYESPDDLTLTFKPASLMFVAGGSGPKDTAWKAMYDLFEVDERTGIPRRSGLTLSEIADALGVSEKTVQRRIDSLPITVTGKMGNGVTALYGWRNMD